MKDSSIMSVPERRPAKRDVQITPEEMIMHAVDQKVPVETMERLLAMRRELKEEKAREAFNASMARFQAECPPIKKTRAVKTKAGQVAYRYAPIDEVVRQVKKLIEKHGFRYATSMELFPDGVRATCRVVHKLGHVEETPMHVPFGSKTEIMSNSQVAAAAQTFAKRYAFLNAFGIMTSDEDTDARPEPAQTQAAAAQDRNIDAIKAIINKSNVGALIELDGKVRGSDKYTAAQKGMIGGLIHARLASLEEQQNAMLGKTKVA